MPQTDTEDSHTQCSLNSVHVGEGFVLEQGVDAKVMVNPEIPDDVADNSNKHDKDEVTLDPKFLEILSSDVSTWTVGQLRHNAPDLLRKSGFVEDKGTGKLRNVWDKKPDEYEGRYFRDPTNGIKIGEEYDQKKKKMVPIREKPKKEDLHDMCSYLQKVCRQKYPKQLKEYNEKVDQETSGQKLASKQQPKKAQKKCSFKLPNSMNRLQAELEDCCKQLHVQGINDSIPPEDLQLMEDSFVNFSDWYRSLSKSVMNLSKNKILSPEEKGIWEKFNERFSNLDFSSCSDAAATNTSHESEDLGKAHKYKETSKTGVLSEVDDSVELGSSKVVTEAAAPPLSDSGACGAYLGNHSEISVFHAASVSQLDKVGSFVGCEEKRLPLPVSRFNSSFDAEETIELVSSGPSKQQVESLRDTRINSIHVDPVTVSEVCKYTTDKRNPLSQTSPQSTHVKDMLTVGESPPFIIGQFKPFRKNYYDSNGGAQFGEIGNRDNANQEHKNENFSPREHQPRSFHDYQSAASISFQYLTELLNSDQIEDPHLPDSYTTDHLGLNNDNLHLSDSGLIQSGTRESQTGGAVKRHTSEDHSGILDKKRRLNPDVEESPD